MRMGPEPARSCEAVRWTRHPNIGFSTKVPKCTDASEELLAELQKAKIYNVQFKCKTRVKVYRTAFGPFIKQLINELGIMILIPIDDRSIVWSRKKRSILRYKGSLRYVLSHTETYYKVDTLVTTTPEECGDEEFVSAGGDRPSTPDFWDDVWRYDKKNDEWYKQ
tara:strand:- start:1181 stop:1675 length:495 start_codon:yes stop_codon:yes gene_type:complete